MSDINQLSLASQLTAGDQFPVFSTNNGDTRRVPLGVLAQFINAQPEAGSTVTQYAQPTATGFSVQVLQSSASVWIILMPTGAFAAGTLVLPANTLLQDKQEVMLNTTQAVTALATNGNGATVIGAPTTLAANAFFRLRYDAPMNTWYRVG